VVVELGRRRPWHSIEDRSAKYPTQIPPYTSLPSVKFIRRILTGDGKCPCASMPKSIDFPLPPFVCHSMSARPDRSEHDSLPARPLALIKRFAFAGDAITASHN
jgi:hypothetical protein